jgi:predicted nuclease of predicted toxin-antitoxin system
MKFKLDENLGARTQDVFRRAGHDVATVHGEHLCGCSDGDLHVKCIAEGRALVTLDLDFSNPLRFPTSDTEGIAVIRIPRNPELKVLEQLIRLFLSQLAGTPLRGSLWIIEPGRIRIHQSHGGE